jgi:hypothetical protein
MIDIEDIAGRRTGLHEAQRFPEPHGLTLGQE